MGGGGSLSLISMLVTLYSRKAYLSANWVRTKSVCWQIGLVHPTNSNNNVVAHWGGGGGGGAQLSKHLVLTLLFLLVKVN